MPNAKSTANVKIDADVKETAAEPLMTNGEKLLAAIKRKGIPHIAVEVNEQGHIMVDKDKDPELYDWAVNG